MFIPYNIDDSHWILFVFNFTTYEYDVYDSLFAMYQDDHQACLDNIKIYFEKKYMIEHETDTCPFTFKHVSNSTGPGPQQPKGCNDCAIYCMFNMLWIALKFHEPPNTNSTLSLFDYCDYMITASNDRTLRPRLLTILLNGMLFL